MKGTFTSPDLFNHNKLTVIHDETIIGSIEEVSPGEFKACVINKQGSMIAGRKAAIDFVVNTHLGKRIVQEPQKPLSTQIQLF